VRRAWLAAPVKSGLHNRHSEQGDNCTPTAFVTPVTLATGAQYFANISPSQLAKSGFVMKLNDAGSLSEIDLNTEPAASDTIKSTAEALKDLLPFAGVVAKQAPAAAVSGGANKQVETLRPASAKPACDAGEAEVKFVPFKSWTGG
jgi:hypothetical protein